MVSNKHACHTRGLCRSLCSCSSSALPISNGKRCNVGVEDQCYRSEQMHSSPIFFCGSQCRIYSNVRWFLFRLRSYHPGNTTSRPISAVKQDRALSSTVVGDHTETKGDVILFCFGFCTSYSNQLKYLVFFLCIFFLSRPSHKFESSQLASPRVLMSPKNE